MTEEEITTTIKDIPKNDRPIERLINNGEENLTNEELIAILLKTGNKGSSSKNLATILLNEVGGVKNLKNIT